MTNNAQILQKVKRAHRALNSTQINWQEECLFECNDILKSIIADLEVPAMTESSIVTPVRIQRKRSKGWRMPEGVIYVGRPSNWGNPFKITRSGSGKWYVVDDFSTDGPYTCKADAAKDAVRFFEKYADIRMFANPLWLEPLRGKNLADWCGLDEVCHADVLLRLANPQPESIKR